MISPNYFVSLIGYIQHYHVEGSKVVYSPNLKGFRLYISVYDCGNYGSRISECALLNMTAQTAEQHSWGVAWIGVNRKGQTMVLTLYNDFLLQF